MHVVDLVILLFKFLKIHGESKLQLRSILPLFLAAIIFLKEVHTEYSLHDALPMIIAFPNCYNICV